MKKNKLTLVILAAGMGSRYGGLKQMDTFICKNLNCSTVSKLWYPNNFLSVVNQSLHFVIMLTQTFQQENLG